MDTLERELKQRGFDCVIGVDEAGRGPLAGPVVAAAVALKQNNLRTTIKDSKQLSASQREKAFHQIYNSAYIGIGIISESVIDQANILNATFFAMTNAIVELISRLPVSTQTTSRLPHNVCLLIDGNQFRCDLPYRYRTIVKGDEKILSIACASIVAKVTRDRILQMYHKIFPEYGFDRHKGYPTIEHRQTIRRLGLSLIHRKTFHCQL